MSEIAAPNRRLLQFAQDLIRIPSVTPVTPDLRPAAQESLSYLKRFLEAAGARCEWLSYEGGHERWGYPVDNLYAEWEVDAGGRSLCFLGHTDVVPAGDPTAWSGEPFSGEIRDGLLHGRGATDMKGAVAAFAFAAAEFAREREAAGARANVSLLITTDEEWAAINGTRRVLEWMKAQGKAPSGFVVGEPSSEEFLGTGIKIGRRGSLVGQLIAKGTQGHAAYAGLYENPNRPLALALAILHSYRWKDGEPFMPATNFETIALNSGDFRASAIIPSDAKALWNIRFTPHQTPSGLAARLQELLANPEFFARDHRDRETLSNLSVIANTDTAALPYYSEPGVLAQLARKTVAARTGLKPAFDAKGGTTDGRFIRDHFPQAEIVELGLPECGGLTRARHGERFGTRGGMHQADESCSIQDLEILMWCYRDLIEAYTGSDE